jgi:hypothetical protein
MRKSTIDRELEYYKIVQDFSEEPGGEQLLRHVDVINLKTASVLTHLSIMIGTSVGIFLFFLEKSGVNVITVLIFCELLGYVALTMFALVGSMITTPRSFSGHEQDAIRRFAAIVWRRRFALLTSIYGAYVTTIALMITLILKMFGVS